MPKLKTHQAAAKRLKKTKQGKFLKRKCGQDHFNSRESGKTTRNKRRDICFSKVFTNTLKAAMPNN